MNEAKTFADAGARAGEFAGSALGTGVHVARREAKRARQRISDGIPPETQDALAERVSDVRRELAARIDPGPAKRHRRRWPWLLALIAVAGAAAAAVLSRRPIEEVAAGDDDGRLADAEPADSSEASGNGASSAHRRSSNTR